MTGRYEIYRMMSKFGPAAVLGASGTKAEALLNAKLARSALQKVGLGRKVKVVVRDTSNRINPIDPFATLAAAASLAWNMAVSARIAKLETRGNPANFDADWENVRGQLDDQDFLDYADVVSREAGRQGYGPLSRPSTPKELNKVAKFYLEAAANKTYPKDTRMALRALAESYAIKGQRKGKKRGNPKSKTIADLERELASLKAQARIGVERVSKRRGPGGTSEVFDVTMPAKTGKGRRKNPTLLIATNPGGELAARGGKLPFSVHDPRFKAALKMFQKFQLGAMPKGVSPSRFRRAFRSFSSVSGALRMSHICPSTDRSRMGLRSCMIGTTRHTL